MNILILFTLLVNLQSFAQSVPQIKSQEPDQTEGCKLLGGKLSSIEYEYLSAAQMIYADDKITPYYFLPGKDVCLKNNAYHSVILTDNHSVLGRVKVELVLAATTLTRARGDLLKVKDSFPEAMDYVDVMGPRFSLLFPDTKENDPIHLVKLSPLEKTPNFFNVYTRVLPPSVRFVKTIGFEELSKMLADLKPIVLDTRAVNDFKIWHLPNAHSVPFYSQRAVDYDEASFQRLVDLQYKFPDKELPDNKLSPVVVFGYSELDSSPYWALHVLRMKGFKRIYWYRGGQNDWERKSQMIPDAKANGDLGTITWQDLEKKRSEFTVVDIRPRRVFLSGHIASSTNIMFNAATAPPPWRHPLRADEMLEGLSFDFKLLPPHAKTLVFVGQDEADWSAFLASKLADKQGYKAYWYGGGYAEWQSLAKWFGEKRFPIALKPDAH